MNAKGIPHRIASTHCLMGVPNLVKEVFTLDRGTYLGQGVPFLSRGYLPWIEGRGIYLGRELPTLEGGYLPWTEGVTTLDGVPTLNRGYLPWMGGRSNLPWKGVLTLDERGTYLGWG